MGDAPGVNAALSEMGAEAAMRKIVSPLSPSSEAG
jgi:hypothetical protein